MLAQALSWPLAIAIALSLVGPAAAQVGASAEIESNELVRGLSVSDGRPSASLSFSYDHPSGLYGGASLQAVDTRTAGLRALGYVVYLGYAGRLDTATTWDVGISHREVSIYVEPTDRTGYTEVYAGVARHGLSLHLYYSPRYIGEGASTLYVDAAGAFHPADHWRLFGRAGLLAPLAASADAPYFQHRFRFDAQAGVAREFTHFELRLSGIATQPAPVYPPGHRQARAAVVAGATYFF